MILFRPSQIMYGQTIMCLTSCLKICWTYFLIVPFESYLNDVGRIKRAQQPNLENLSTRPGLVQST